MLILNLDIDPVAKGRARVGRWGVYTPAKTRKFEEKLKALIVKDLKKGYELITKDTPIVINATFVLKKPKSSKKVHPTGRPDLDNYLKALLDACNDLVWEDDSSIIKIVSTKCYGLEGAILLMVMNLDEAKNSGL